jgi:hypothetical protein
MLNLKISSPALRITKMLKSRKRKKKEKKITEKKRISTTGSRNPKIELIDIL